MGDGGVVSYNSPRAAPEGLPARIYKYAGYIEHERKGRRELACAVRGRVLVLRLW